MINKASYLMFLMLAFSFNAFTQQELSLAAFDQCKQASLINPSFRQSSSGVVGFPSVVFNFSNSGFTYRDLVKKRDDDSLYLDVDNTLKKMDATNHITANLHIYNLVAGFRKENYQIDFSIATKTNVWLSYPRELPQLIWKGNRQFLGETVNIGPGFRASKYTEYAVGAAYFFKQLNIGGRIKLLNGIANVTTSQHDFYLTTDTSDYALTVSSDYIIHTSNRHALASFSPSLSNASNPGVAFDLGATYRSKKLMVAMSIVDVGFIQWRDNLATFKSKNAYTFEGIDVFQYFYSDTFSIASYKDSLQKITDFEVSLGQYNTKLTPQFYTTVSYCSGDRNKYTLVLYGEMREEIQPAASIGYVRSFSGSVMNLDLGLHYSYKPGSFNNFGLNTVLTYRSFRLFIIGDNFLSWLFPKASIPLDKIYLSDDNSKRLIIPQHLKNVNFRVGINWLIEP